MSEKRLGHAYEEYRTSANKFVEIEDQTYECWLDFCKWYQSEGKHLFVSAFTEASGMKFPRPRSMEWLVRSGIAGTEKEYKKIIAEHDYYRANAFWFLEEVDCIVETTPVGDGYSKLAIVYGQTLHFVESLIRDSLVLLRECASLLSGLDESGVHKNPVTQLSEFYVTARYLIYDAVAVGHHSDVSISVIRQALEIRVRRAFGIIAKADPSGTEHPVSLSEIIAVLKGKKIDMAVPLSSLKRINGWANMYLHSGIKEYSWVAPRILEYLATFLLGRPAPGYLATSNGGVITDEETFREIREQLEQRCRPDYELLSYPRQYCAIVITKEPAKTT